MSIPHNNLRKRIFSTLAYFDIFDFPLTEDEIIRFLHTSQKLVKKNLENDLKNISSKKMKNLIVYFLPKKEKNIEKRKEREAFSATKIEKVKKILNFLGFIPTVAYIGISGSLAMKNGDEDSDIDLFIIAFHHSVWTTRFITWVALLILGKRRKRNTSGKNDICLNMIMDRNNLLFSYARQDIYTAHEIVQVLPIVNKYKTYELFLQKNKWVLHYMANSFEEKKQEDELPMWLEIFLFILIPLEKILENIQIWYMKQHKTIEQTTSDFIAFHPIDYRGTIVKEFQKREKTYAL